MDGLVNRDDFLGILCFDKWVDSTARRAVFHSHVCPHTSRKQGYMATMLHNSHAVFGQQRALIDPPRSGLYKDPYVYRDVTGLYSFEKWRCALESMSGQDMLAARKAIPAEWCPGEALRLDGLLEQLDRKKSRIVELLSHTRYSSPHLVPRWF